MYNRRTTKLVPIKGKHTKRITCGNWSTTENVIGLGSNDMQITISDTEGDTIVQLGVEAEPYQIEFNHMKRSKRHTLTQDIVLETVGHTTISANIGGGQLWLYDYKKREEIVLAFNVKYGSILQYRWFDDGYIMLGFKSGYVCIVSTHQDEIGAEISAAKMHSESLGGIAYSSQIQKGASIGDDCVKIFSMSDLKTFYREQNIDKYQMDNEYGTLTGLEWTNDGQILSVSSENGNIYSFLTSIPVINGCYGSSAVYLSSLRELCVRDIVRDEIRAHIEIDIEPSFVSLGENHVAVGMNNRVWYYRIPDRPQDSEKHSMCIGDREYLSTVENVRMNAEYAVVQVGGKAVVQRLRASSAQTKNSADEIIFPQTTAGNEGVQVTDVHVNDQFIMFCTTHGSINIFSLEDWTMVSEYRFDIGIQSIYPNRLGTRIIFVDETHAAYLYNPVDDAIAPVEKFPGTAETVLWDLFDSSTFVVVDKNHFTTYAYSRSTKRSQPIIEAVKRINPKHLQQIVSLVGRINPHNAFRENLMVKKLEASAVQHQQQQHQQQHEQVLCKTDRPEGFKPMVYVNGRVVCQMPSGTLGTVALQSHDIILHMEARQKGSMGFHISISNSPLFSMPSNVSASTPEKTIIECFYQLMNLFKFHAAWNLARTYLPQAPLLQELAARSLDHVDIETACRCYQVLGDTAMVFALEKLRDTDEINIILGNVALLQKNFAEVCLCFIFL